MAPAVIVWFDTVPGVRPTDLESAGLPYDFPADA